MTIPYAWKESDWPDALLRIRSAAKAYEESNQRLEIKACFNIAHKVSSETEVDWAGALVAYRKSKGKKVKDSNWENKYMPVLVDFKHDTIDGRRKYKKDSQGKKNRTPSHHFSFRERVGWVKNPPNASYPFRKSQHGRVPFREFITTIYCSVNW